MSAGSSHSYASLFVQVEAELASSRQLLADLRGGGGMISTQSQLDSAQEDLKEAVHKEEQARELHAQVRERGWGQACDWDGKGGEGRTRDILLPGVGE